MTAPLDFLFSLERLGMKFGLANIAALCAALSHPERAFASIIIAGTNGKGSVAAMCDAAVRAAGHRCGRYTSPHLVRLEERFLVNGAEVSTPMLAAAVARVRDAAEGLVASGALESLPTFFECATAAAFELFRDARVELAVLEVGLGGRLDSTNVVAAIAAAIVSIDFDHEALLGDTLAAIAAEKAGVIKPGIPVVCGPLPAAAMAVVARICGERGATLIQTGDDARLAREIARLPLALKGEHQRANAAVAWRLLEALDRLGFAVGREAIVEGLTQAQWPARLEWLPYREHGVLIDAAHNPAGARALVAYLADRGARGCDLRFRRDAGQGGRRHPRRAGAGSAADDLHDRTDPARLPG